MKIEIYGKNNLYIIFTRDIFTEEEIEKMRVYCESIDWDNAKYVLFPSEYIEKIEVIER